MTRQEAIDELVRLGAKTCGAVMPREHWDAQPATWDFERTLAWNREHPEGLTRKDGVPCACEGKRLDAGSFAVSLVDYDDGPPRVAPADAQAEDAAALVEVPAQLLTEWAKFSCHLSDDAKARIAARLERIGFDTPDADIKRAQHDAAGAIVAEELAKCPLRVGLRFDLWWRGVPMRELDALDDAALIQRARSYLHEKQRAREDHEAAEQSRRFSVN